MTDLANADAVTDDKATADGGDKGAGAPDAKGGDVTATAGGGGKGADAKGVDAKGAGDKGKTIATGADAETDDKTKEEGDAKAAAAKPAWPDDWREKLAEHASAGNKKAYEKELNRLKRIADPAGVYGMYRELEGKFTGGGLIKVPGKDAKPEEIAAYHKAIGVPDKPEGYIEHVKLDNGAVIGEADKPLVDAFAKELHKAGAPPSAMNAALNWYYKQQEAAAAALDDADDSFRRESEKALKEELGPAFKRTTNAIASVFATAEGGADINNPNSVYAEIMGGRTASGKIIGNHPGIVRWLASIVSEINPAATVVEEGAQSGKSIDQELADIDKTRRANRSAYNKDYKMQARERELLEAQSKIQSRQRA